MTLLPWSKLLDTLEHVKYYLKKILKYGKRQRRKVYPNTDVDHFQVLHLPDSFTRRADDFTANIFGIYGEKTRHARYRVNGSNWIDIQHELPRVPKPLFTIELSHEEFISGSNSIEVEVEDKTGNITTHQLQCGYNPQPLQLPLEQSWDTNTALDVGDGKWERLRQGNETRVRPVPGFEDYDRILIITGAFAGGRRITTDLVFHSVQPKGAPYGFGILPLWGGRPDQPGHTPRRGWKFSLVWYYSHYEAIGMEFSYKFADQPPAWVASYKNFDLIAGRRYLLTVETYPVHDTDGKHLHYFQRMRWEDKENHNKTDWMQLTDIEGAPIPEGEYGVALIAHRSQVDFGRVIVEPLPAKILERTNK